MIVRRSVASVFLASLSFSMAMAVSSTGRGADLVALSPQTWDRYVPQGKEVDAIHGDFALVNDQIHAVIAHPKRGRNANMTVREVGGCLIDLTRRDRQSDQLSAYYPGAQLRDLKFAGIGVDTPEVYETESLDRVFVKGRRVELRVVASPRERQPDVEVTYALEDGKPYIEVTTTFTNRSASPIDVELLDAFRADASFDQSPETPADLFWAYDKHFGQAYGIIAEGHDVQGTKARRNLLKYRDREGKGAIQLSPGASYRLTRRIIPGATLLDVHATAGRLAGKTDRALKLTVKDTKGQPIAGADVVLSRDNQPKSWGRTDKQGTLSVTPGDAPGATLVISAIGNGSKTVQLADTRPESLSVEFPEAGLVEAKITDGAGKAIPCKVQFVGKGGTASPNFGPDSGEHGVRNVYYSHDGSFRRTLEPGTYDVIVSYGPEHDAIIKEIAIERGKTTRLDGKLVRSVKTDGWISSDFHSHSTPSGDNTASQYGRVLNLLCEQIDFAPCTEHNRLSTYDPILKKLRAERRMGTCVGMELTGTPLPLNHQNAFPLILRPNTQDGGGPSSDLDPETQIERLALWDGGSDKLVQVNHPDMGWMFRDRDGDGKADKGFAAMVGNMDVIEVHPPHQIFEVSAEPSSENAGSNNISTIVGWLQLLNQGRRIPGVVNTDAHYNFHGSGFLRNYIKSPTDEPAEIKTLDIVHASERGNLVMTNGPFLEVKLRGAASSAKDAGPGDNLAASGGDTSLSVKVQCPNWFDIDRVQVFLNGRPSKSLNFTREANPDKFSTSTMKFDQVIPLKLDKDTHVIVAVIGEHSKLGPVMGPDHAATLPVAVSNPIFVDVDGQGFKANGDVLGKLAVKKVR